MMSNQTKIICAGAGVLLLALAARGLWSDGRISVNFQGEPLSKVIPVLERATHLDLETNLPPETPVTLRMEDAEAWEVLLTLATRLDARLQPTVLAGPDAAVIAAALDSYRTGAGFGEWEVFRVRGSEVSGAEEIDASGLPVTVEPAGTLHGQLEQISQKTGLAAAAPKTWNPPAAPAGQNKAASAVIGAAANAGGRARHLYLITGRPSDRGRPGGESGPPGDGPRWSGSERGGSGRGGNPEWESARLEATLAALPDDRRAAARAEFDEFRKFREEMRNLPEDERRAKAEEFFSRPEIQERMAERMTSRDNRSSPEQRQQRMKRYVERKAQMKSSAQ